MYVYELAPEFDAELCVYDAFGIEREWSGEAEGEVGSGSLALAPPEHSRTVGSTETYSLVHRSSSDHQGNTKRAKERGRTGIREEAFISQAHEEAALTNTRGIVR